MDNFKQFIVYKLVPSTSRPGRTEKVPIDYRTGSLPARNSGASSIWTDKTTATAAAIHFGKDYGIGFSFAQSDPYFFIDIDHCLEPSGQWSALAQQLIAAFPGAYVEVSQSGTGLHIIGSGTPPLHSCKNAALGLEFYHEGRFVALTGIHATGDPDRDFTNVLAWLTQYYFPPRPLDEDSAANWTTTPVPEWNGPANDEELIRRALRSTSASSAFGNRASFADLWYADAEALGRAYPDSKHPYYDESSADMALATHLMFWTGRNCERVYNLMLQSGLKREKWEREEYLRGDGYTIMNAYRMSGDVLQDKPAQTLPMEYDSASGAVTATPTPTTGSTFLTLDQQMHLFRGCVYVCDQHRVLIPGGMLLKPDQFRVTYGGFSFPMDQGNERVVRNAWECFTESQAFRSPRADTSCFRPDLSPGSVINVDGQTLANTWWPVETRTLDGDATPFFTHMEKILPIQRDREILLAYMAACVQYKGHKFQWAPLIQGVEGNGKTLLTRCVAFAVGARYSHFPKASQIATKFNDWMHGRIFIGVEDIYVPESQREVIEELKPMITENRLEIEGKNKDKVSLQVCCNFMLNTNHRGALRKTKNDRRFANFYTPQQQEEDLIRDGMDGSYFYNLYHWLKHGQGYEIVNHVLQNYDIPAEFDPTKNMQRAPKTSSTAQAIVDGMGRVEQEILEAIDREEIGFKGGWVSSMAIDRLLERIGAARSVPPNKRRDIMLALGYDYHPGLRDGRVNNSVLPDNGKPRLFAHMQHAEIQAILIPADIARAYSLAQTSSVESPPI